MLTWMAFSYQYPGSGSSFTRVAPSVQRQHKSNEARSSRHSIGESKQYSELVVVRHDRGSEWSLVIYVCRQKERAQPALLFKSMEGENGTEGVGEVNDRV